MFVLTALAAALSDLAIVYLGLRRPSDATDDNDSALLVAGSLLLPNILNLLTILAAIRLASLLPLGLYTTRGGRVPCQRLYAAYHAICGLIMLGISAWSVGVYGLTVASGDADDNGGHGDAAHAYADADTDAKAPIRDHLYLMISLSILSTMLHLVLLLHVRSTAPTSQSLIHDALARRGRKDHRRRKMMAYYAYRRYYGDGGGVGAGATGMGADGNANGRVVMGREEVNNDNDHDDDDFEGGSPSKSCSSSKNGRIIPSKKKKRGSGSSYDYDSIDPQQTEEDVMDEDMQPLARRLYEDGGGDDDDGAQGDTSSSIQHDEEQGGEDGNNIFRRSMAGPSSTAAAAAAASNSSNDGPVIVALPGPPPQPTTTTTQRPIPRGNSFGDKYDIFMSDLQQRLDEARRQWTERLNDVQRSLNSQLHHHQEQQHHNNQGGGRNDDGDYESDYNYDYTGNYDDNGIDMDMEQFDAMQHGEQSSSPLRQSLQVPPVVGANLRFLHLSPFRALLQLYAYEDVFGTGKLDRAFDVDNEDAADALVFYAPQLLSFLLHGAFLTSPVLEAWILDKCRTNIHFAHQCFWFLRAWCLGQGSHAHSVVEADDMESINGEAPSLSSSVRRGSESNLYLVDAVATSAAASGDQSDALSRRNSKFPQEEHRLIEDLLHKVIECGEAAAVPLQHGPLHPSFDEVETTALSSAGAYQSTDDIAPDWLPTDTDGKPSASHLNVLRSSGRRYGFSPLERDGDGSHFQEAASGDENLFLATPTFIDALTSIADDLMLVENKADRTPELQARLRALELELLPSNVVYLPVHDVNHRAWRIVADESIALSTNERVPCIVVLEVLSYDADEMHQGRATSVDAVARRLLANAGGIHDVSRGEKDVLRAWYTEERPPQRHNTLRDKIKVISKKWQHDMTDKVHQQRDRLLDSNFRGMMGNGGSNVLSAVPAGTPDLLERVGGDVRAVRDISALDSMEGRPPLARAGSASNASTLSLTARARRESKTSISPSSSRASTRPSSPTQAMGQWHSPGIEKKKRSRMTVELLDVKMRLQGEPHGIDALAMPPLGTHEAMAQGNTTECGLERPSTDTDNIRKQQKKRSRPPPVVFKEDWATKTERLRAKSAYGSDPRWKLLPILIKSNDDLRQEQLVSQLIYRCASILARAKVPVWLYPYSIISCTDRGGIMEAIPDTISLSSLKSNDPNYVDLKTFFCNHFGPPGGDDHAQAKANFVESLAAYSVICYLLQIKDRHNGNILLTNRGHLVHIDFGFVFLSSPGKNSGFESAPFKLTSDFVDVMDGPDSHAFDKFRELCYRTFLELRKHCYQIILVVEMLQEGGEDLQCFCGQPERAIEELRQRFRLDLNDRACKQYVDGLIDESIGNWRTSLYDRYQRVCVGVL